MRSTTMLPVKLVTVRKVKTRLFALKMAVRHGLETYRELRRMSKTFHVHPGYSVEIQSTFRVE